MIPVKYQNHRGRSIDLNAHGVISNVSDMSVWELEVDDAHRRIGGLTPALQSFTFSCATYSNAARSALYDVPAVDVDAMRPGRLYVGEWYLVCYITGASQSRGADTSGMAKYSITVTPALPFWRRDREKVLTERHEGGTGLDYEHDYDYDYGYAPTSNFVENRTHHLADLLIRIYGDCVDPVVKIGENSYSVDVEVKQGDRLEIDTSEKTVKVVKLDGTVENAFAHIAGEYRENSGSYIFQKMPSGTSNVTWSGTYDLDIVVVEHANEPRWWE